MHATELFVYGTLRHDQPEHALHCRGVHGWRAAQLRGKLFQVPGGYRLLVVPREAILHMATGDPGADEHARAAIDSSRLAVAASALDRTGSRLIEGELLAFADASVAWPPLDAWENCAPGVPGVYLRCVLPVEYMAGGEIPARLVAAWCYAATEPPPGAIAIA